MTQVLRKTVRWIRILYSSCTRIILLPNTILVGRDHKKQDGSPFLRPLPNNNKSNSNDTPSTTSILYRTTTTTKSTTLPIPVVLLLYRIIIIYAIIITIVVIRMSIILSSSSSALLSNCSKADTNNTSTSSQRLLPVMQQQQQEYISSIHHNTNENIIHESSSNNNYNNNKKKTNNNNMIAVVHIGPHKTGTTTIQYESTRLYKQLLFDHYELPSTFLYGASTNHYRLAHCLKQSIVLNRTIQYLSTTTTTTITSNTHQQQIQQQQNNLNPNEYCDSDFLVSILRIALRKNNILLSAERFATPSVLPSMIETILLPWKPNIYIVAYYRYYYDWFISWHNQIMKRKLVPDRIPIIEWIHDTNRLYTLYNTIYSYGCIKRYQKQFSIQNVVIYNIHTPTTNLIRDFFCSVLPNTPKTCHYVTQEQELKLQNQQLQQQLQQKQDRRRLVRFHNATANTRRKSSLSSLSSTINTKDNLFTRLTRGGQQGNTITTAKNSAVILIYEEIAYAMIQRYKLLFGQRKMNDLDSTTQRQQQQHRNDGVVVPYSIPELSILVQQEHEIRQGRESPNDFDSVYRICPHQSSLNILWNLTLAAQNEFFPTTSSSILEEQLRTNFTIASTTINALCSLNTTALLTEHPQWKIFFEQHFNITPSLSSNG